MISANLDLQQLGIEIRKISEDFGEANESAIARWGVAVCRRLVTVTQAWGDGIDAKKKQQNAMLKDANRAVFSVSKAALVTRIRKGKMSGLIINGELVRFSRERILVTPEQVNDFIDMHRTSRKGRVPVMKPGLKGITSSRVLSAAMRKRSPRAGKAKGGWIGAGQEIGRYQRKGSRITIGKNVANYAHKWKSGGGATMRRSIWSPEGTMINSYSHVSNEHVLKRADMEKAIMDGGRNTITWYEKTMQARLNKRK